MPHGGQDKERGAHCAAVLEVLRGGAFLVPPIGRYAQVKHLAGEKAAAAHWSLLPMPARSGKRGKKKEGHGGPKEVVVRVVSSRAAQACERLDFEGSVSSVSGPAQFQS